MTTPTDKLKGIWEGSYSHVPFGTFVEKYHAKFYSHVPLADFTDKLGLTTPPEDLSQPPPPPSEPSVGMGEYTTGGEGTPEDASSVYRPALEYGGLAAGAAGGLASPVPGGSVIGAGLGYGAGKGMADLLDEWAGLKKAPSTGQRFARSAEDILTGGAMEAGGQLLGAGLAAGGKAIAESKGAQRLYSSSIKMPLSRKWTKARGPEGVSDVKKAVGKGLDESIPPSEYGLEITKKGKAQAAKDIDSEISKMTGTYSTDQILEKGLQRAIDKAARGEAPAANLEKIKAYAKTLKDGRGKDLTPTELNNLKKELYELANYDKQAGVADSLLETMRKGVAHEARLQLQATNPALKDVNADYASWRLLEEALERSLARKSNRDLFSLGTKVLIGRHSWPVAIFNETIGHPAVKSRIAFMLKNAGKVTGATISKPAAYLTVPPASPNLLSP